MKVRKSICLIIGFFLIGIGALFAGDDEDGERKQEEDAQVITVKGVGNFLGARVSRMEITIIEDYDPSFVTDQTVEQRGEAFANEDELQEVSMLLSEWEMVRSDQDDVVVAEAELLQFSQLVEARGGLAALWDRMRPVVCVGGRGCELVTALMGFLTPSAGETTVTALAAAAGAAGVATSPLLPIAAPTLIALYRAYCAYQAFNAARDLRKMAGGEE